jgi:cytochrome c551/c552
MGDSNTSEGLWRWLVGGLVAGLMLLGLLVAAYTIGYHEGTNERQTVTRAATQAPNVSSTTASTPTPAATSTSAVPTSPALVARGKALYDADGCQGCHALDSSTGVGPGFKGLAGSTVKLTNGRTPVADDAYLERAIIDPDADIVLGYRAGLMQAAVAGLNLRAQPADVRALVAFIKAQ